MNGEQLMEQMILLSLFSGSFFTLKNGLIIALIVGFLALFFIIAFVIIYLCKRDEETKDIIKDSINDKGRIYKAIKNMILEDGEISMRFSNRVRSDNSLTKAEIERIVQQRVDVILEGFQKKQQEKACQPIIETATTVDNGVRPNAAVLYASCVDEKKRSFYSVTKIPDKDTIFVLELNPENGNEATFTVYEKVFKKVIEEQGHLKEGCVIENPEMNKTTHIKTIAPGLTYCNNGEWIIKEKATIKFE